MSNLIAHRPDHYDTYRVFDRLVLSLDLGMEHIRYDKFAPFIEKHGGVCQKAEYPYNEFPLVPYFNRCYDSAMWAAKEYGLIYCEGMLLFRGPRDVYPMGHGWCINPANGMVVDQLVHGYQGDKRLLYVGIPIKKDYHERWRKKVGTTGCLMALQMQRESDFHGPSFRMER